ncbi:MAG: DUF2179 domain-containing protein [Firmicutes bacterium]|nr:DUF2179 domain-containing protein [Bacillota bacterium]
MELGVIAGYLLIFLARVVDVSLGTIRIMMIVQGRKLQAAIIGFFEVTTFVVALGVVVNQLDDIGNLLAYSLGFACGNYVGSVLEGKMALGNLTAQIIINKNYKDVVNTLRQEGFGVTVLEGEGKNGIRKVLKVTLKRRDLKILHEIVDGIHNEAFITVSDAKYIKGGYFTKLKKK